MATYVISDVHGEYQKLTDMLVKIDFKDSDTLYLLGDMIDRGKQGLKVVQLAMQTPNIVTLMGNHEYMAIKPINWLYHNDMQQFANMPTDLKENFVEWLNIGGQSTINEFQAISHAEQGGLCQFISQCLPSKKLTVNGRQFVLVHAGIDHFAPTKALSDYRMEELIFNKPAYYLTYFDDRYLVTGHTPTRYIMEEELNLARGVVDRSGHQYDKIVKMNNHIAIDCGCGYGGRLGAIRLDDLQEFYV